jgi:hypothetical protein
MEEWRTIKDFPDYQVSNLGRVKSLVGRYGIEERILKGGYVGRKTEQYHAVTLYNETEKYQVKTHKLVAEYFLENPNSYPCIDHINRNRFDNRVENLRYVPYQINAINTTRKPNKLNQQYIYPTKSGNYIVNIRRFQKPIASKVFKTLEEAIAYRDSILHQNSSHPT